jgi:hypothetical protein
MSKKPYTNITIFHDADVFFILKKRLKSFRDAWVTYLLETAASTYNLILKTDNFVCANACTNNKIKPMLALTLILAYVLCFDIEHFRTS